MMDNDNSALIEQQDEQLLTERNSADGSSSISQERNIESTTSILDTLNSTTPIIIQAKIDTPSSSSDDQDAKGSNKVELPISLVLQMMQQQIYILQQQVQQLTLQVNQLQRRTDIDKIKEVAIASEDASKGASFKLPPCVQIIQQQGSTAIPGQSFP